jgi:hypothetical protein
VGVFEGKGKVEMGKEIVALCRARAKLAIWKDKSAFSISLEESAICYD